MPLLGADRVGGLREAALAAGGGALVHDALARGLVERLARPREPARWRACASPSAIAACTFFCEVFRAVRTALLRSRRTSFCLFRLICDLMFAISADQRTSAAPGGSRRPRRARTMGSREHRHLPHPQLLHRGAHRPRQVDAGRPAARGDPHGRRPRHARAVPRQDGPRARARDHDQGAGGAAAARGLRAEPDRHARATSTSPTRCRARSRRARARCCSSTRPRASRRRRWRTTTWRATPAW